MSFDFHAVLRTGIGNTNTQPITTMMELKIARKLIEGSAEICSVQYVSGMGGTNCSEEFHWLRITYLEDNIRNEYTRMRDYSFEKGGEFERLIGPTFHKLYAKIEDIVCQPIEQFTHGHYTYKEVG